MMTPEQIEAGLTDKDWKIRRKFIRRKSFIPTSAQLERGLTDSEWKIRKAFLNLKGVELTPWQIERGLTDENADARLEFARRSPFITPTQFERGLTDLNLKVVHAFIRRYDCIPTHEQIERGLSDSRPFINDHGRKLDGAENNLTEAVEENTAKSKLLARIQGNIDQARVNNANIKVPESTMLAVKEIRDRQERIELEHQEQMKQQKSVSSGLSHG